MSGARPPPAAIGHTRAGGDPGLRDAAYDLLGTVSFLFGIPLSFLALFTGIALGVGSKWACSARAGSRRIKPRRRNR